MDKNNLPLSQEEINDLNNLIQKDNGSGLTKEENLKLMEYIQKINNQVLSQEEIDSLKENFKRAVEDKDLRIVRLSLSNELLLDPRGKTFSKMLIYAKNKLPDLFEENKKGSYTLMPKEKWNEDFLFDVKSDLDTNFSLEKLIFYEEVIKVVGKEKAEQLEEEELKAQHIIEKNSNGIIKEKETSSRPLSVTITAGGAVLTAIGICLGKTLFTIFGGAALVGGVLLLINDRKKK